MHFSTACSTSQLAALGLSALLAGAVGAQTMTRDNGAPIGETCRS